MRKRNMKYHARLVAELQSLRKGGGLVLEKTDKVVILREITARTLGVDVNGITNSQVHNLLLTEVSKLPHTPIFTALRYALSLAEDTKMVDTLAKRRRALARSLEKHVDTIIRYENQAIRNLADVLESLDTPLSSSSRGVTGRAEMPYTHALKIMRETTIVNLSGLLAVGKHTPDLVDYLERSQRPFLDTTVDIKFSPSSRGDNWYRLEAKYTFTGFRNTFRLAVVIDSEDGEQLLMQGLIDEFHKLNDRIDPTKEIRAILNGSRFTAYNHQLGSQKLFRFQELEQDQADRLLQSVGKPLKAHCRFLEIIIPPQWQAEGIIYEYKNVLNLRDDIHYAYWYAPSMMYLKKLVFDYSHFPNLDSWNFVAMPFLGHVAGESVRDSHSFVVHSNGWIMPGHGVALIWEVPA